MAALHASGAKKRCRRVHLDSGRTECCVRRCEKIIYNVDLSVPLTPGPSPRWGEGKVKIKFNSLAPTCFVWGHSWGRGVNV